MCFSKVILLLYLVLGVSVEGFAGSQLFNFETVTDQMSSGYGSVQWGQSVVGTHFSINKKTFSKGLGTHAPSILGLKLDGNAAFFEAEVGVDSGKKRPLFGSVHFLVKGDGKVLWDSGVMRGNDSARTVHVNLEGVQRLVLEVTDAGSVGASDHADWIKPVLSYRGEEPVAAFVREAEFMALVDQLKRVGRSPEALLEDYGVMRRFLEQIVETGVPPELTPFFEQLARVKYGSGIRTKNVWADLKHPLQRLAMDWEAVQSLKLAPEKMIVARSASIFPELVDQRVPRVKKEVAISLQKPGWKGTGLYAPPGESVTVTVPQSFLKLKPQVLIGCYTDRLWHKEFYRRAPEVSRTFNLTEETTVVASGYGGLIYLVLSGQDSARIGARYRFGRDDYLGLNADKKNVSTACKVLISGAVEAPYFVSGKTSPQAWNQLIKNSGVPVAEIEGKHMICSGPIEHFLPVQNPQDVCDFWDAMVELCGEFIGISREYAVPMRMVSDCQISAGQAHSGYPVMGHENWKENLDIRTLKKEGAWGIFHEVGHNHQWSKGWTFQDQGEVTCNLFSLYANAKLCGWDIRLQSIESKPVVPWKKVLDRAEHQSFKLNFKKNSSPENQLVWLDLSPRERLQFYVQLIDGFGWEPLKKVIQSYRQEDDPKFPKSEAGRAGEYLVRYSIITKKNLYPFFRAWGFELPAGIEKEVDRFPVWMPDL